MTSHAHGAINAVAYSPDGRLVATAGEDGAAIVEDAATGRSVRTLRAGADAPATGEVIAVDFAPDGRHVALADGSGFVGYWDETAGSRLWRRRVDLWAADAATVAPDGRTIAVGGQESGDVTLLAARTGLPLHGPVHVAAGFVLSLAFDPTGTLLATAGTDGAVGCSTSRARSSSGPRSPGR